MFPTLQQWLASQAFAAFLVFGRLGTALSVMPGFSEHYVPVRFRFFLAATMTIVVTPVVQGLLPALPRTVPGLLVLLAGEIGIGLFIGLATRMTFNTLQTAGTIISMQSGLSAALAFNPTTAQESALTSALLAAVSLVLVFVSDLHHLMLRAIVDSYSLFPPGQALPIGDFADTMTRLLTTTFSLGLRIAAPFVVFGVIFFLGLGILARLMPQMQVFFVSQPAQILLGLLIFAGTLVAGVSVFLGNFEDTLAIFIAPTLVNP
ncbi:MAG TPA: flagellar biosynthetic protein FliR [Alphaproteobacteria bacterium]